MADPRVLLSVQNVTLSYGGHPAVRGVSFALHAGENMCLIGANGSGKSTLIKGILRLMPLDAGEVKLPCGLNRVGYLAQLTTSDRDFPATVREIVLSGTQTSGWRLPFYTKANREAADAAMERLKISEFSKRRIGSLSGGQQQRVLLARAMARNPALLVLDEPCSALDPEITAELYRLFDQLRAEDGIAMLISTHDWDYVERSADTVLVLNREVEFIGAAAAWRARRGGIC